MARRPIRIRVVREFPFPRDAAYEWLTDIEDDDVARAAGAVIEARRVIERSPERLVYEGETGSMGRRVWSVTEVTFQRPDRWHARVIDGPRLGSETDYHLESLDGGARSRLTVDYGFVFVSGVTHAIARLAHPILARDLGMMWDGFAASMARELEPMRVEVA